MTMPSSCERRPPSGLPRLLRLAEGDQQPRRHPRPAPVHRLHQHYTPDDPIPPAQNYPPGWLQAAYAEISAQPQVRSLIWFLDYDGSGDRRWDAFSLSTGFGQMYEAARDFEALLKRK